LRHDVELLRSILLYLETRQASPRAIVLIMIEDEAAEIGSRADALRDGLELLLELDYIDGPGPDVDGVWLFRKLTRKGIAFLQAARDPAGWDRLKRLHDERVRALRP
jgi:hypothetical protein